MIQRTYNCALEAVDDKEKLLLRLILRKLEKNAKNLMQIA